MASFSSIDIGIHSIQDDDNQSNLSYQNSIHSSLASTPKRKRADTGIRLQTMKKDNRRPPRNSDLKHDDDEEQFLVSHYDNNRLKQERLSLITNIFRLLVVLILGPILYAIV